MCRAVYRFKFNQQIYNIQLVGETHNKSLCQFYYYGLYKICVDVDYKLNICALYNEYILYIYTYTMSKNIRKIL